MKSELKVGSVVRLRRIQHVIFEGAPDGELPKGSMAWVKRITDHPRVNRRHVQYVAELLHADGRVSCGWGEPDTFLDTWEIVEAEDA